MSVRSMSETVRVPEVERAALVSLRDAVLMLPVPIVMVGASLTGVTSMMAATELAENAVDPPAVFTDEVPPAKPLVWSHA